MKLIFNAMALFSCALILGSAIVVGLAYWTENDVALQRVEHRLEGQIEP